MVAGNIPGRTSTLSLAIYFQLIPAPARDEDAFRLLAVAAVIAFAAVWAHEAILRQASRP